MEQLVDGPPYGTREWVAARYGVSVQTINAMVKEGTIPCLRFNRRVVFTEAILEPWEQEQARKSLRTPAPEPAPAPARRRPRRSTVAPSRSPFTDGGTVPASAGVEAVRTSTKRRQGPVRPEGDVA